MFPKIVENIIDEIVEDGNRALKRHIEKVWQNGLLKWWWTFNISKRYEKIMKLLMRV